MSIEAVEWVLAQDPESFTPTERHILTVLAFKWADPTGGSIFPSQGTIAKATSLTDRAIRENLHRLTERGVLPVVGRRGRGISEYRIAMELTPAQLARTRNSRNHVPTNAHASVRRNGVPRNHVPLTPEPRSAHPGTTFRSTPEPGSDKPLMEPLMNRQVNRHRAHARDRSFASEPFDRPNGDVQAIVSSLAAAKSLQPDASSRRDLQRRRDDDQDQDAQPVRPSFDGKCPECHGTGYAETGVGLRRCTTRDCDTVYRPARRTA